MASKETRSWGHEMRSLNDEDRAYVFASTIQRPSWIPEADWEAREQVWLAARRRCSKLCPNDVAYVVEYRYITGRGGRVGRHHKYVCENHGQKFAKAHSIFSLGPDIDVPAFKRGERGI